jgi:hypothetical protein
METRDMTQDNIFQEVQEDLDRQKLAALWKRFGWLAIALALCIVLGTAGYNFWQSRKIAKNQEATGQLIELLGETGADQSGQIAALEAFAGQYKKQTQAIIAELHVAAYAAKQRDDEKALRIYDWISSNKKADPAFRQLADLLAVRTQLDSADPAALQQRLQPLMAADAPWRYSAMEYSAFLELRARDKAAAKKLFTQLSQDPKAPQSIGDRATDMVRYLSE